jgi:GST-like protein
MPMIELHYWPTPNGHKVTMLLEEAGLEYRIVPVDIGRGEQFRPEFLRIAPNNRMPAIVDHAPSDGGAPVSLFESGAILLYLGREDRPLRPRRPARAGRGAPVAVLADGRPRADGRAEPPLLAVRAREAPLRDRPLRERDQPALRVLDRRLADREFVAGADYTIADMASYPWIVPHERQGQDLNDFPNLKRWFEAVGARAATVRAYEAGERYRTRESTVDEESRKVLFGQTAKNLGPR